MPHPNKHRSSFSIERLKLHQATENNGYFGMEIHSYQIILLEKNMKLKKNNLVPVRNKQRIGCFYNYHVETEDHNRITTFLPTGVRLFARRTFTTPKIRTFTTPKFGHFPPPQKNICQEDNCHPQFFLSFFGLFFLAFSTYSSWRTSRREGGSA